MKLFIDSLGRRTSLALSTAAFFCLLIGWGALASALAEPLFLPSPRKVIEALGSLFAGRGFAWDILISVLRVSASVLLGLLMALPSGLALALNKRFEAAAEPISAALRYTPVTALIPVLMFALGIGEMHKIAVLTVGVFVQLLPVVVQTFRSVERNYIAIGRTYGLSDFQLIQRVLLPRVLPSMIDSLRASFAIAWAYVVLVEFWGASAGIGYRLWLSQRFKHPDEMYACAIVMGLLGLATDIILVNVRRTMFRWERGRTLGSISG